MNGGAAVSTLNCVDLSNPDIQKTFHSLKKVCLDCGFFYVVNHGISVEFMDEVLYQSRKFFALPLEDKMELLRTVKHRGYTPMLDEQLDPDNQVHGDFKKGYYIGVEVSEDDPKAKKLIAGRLKCLDGGILWRNIISRHFSLNSEVARATARIIALALDLDANFFDKPEMLGQPIATLRLLHYDGRKSDPSNGIYGAGAHSDFGFITLLATDDVVGLQVSPNTVRDLPMQKVQRYPCRFEYIQSKQGLVGK